MSSYVYKHPLRWGAERAAMSRDERIAQLEAENALLKHMLMSIADGDVPHVATLEALTPCRLRYNGQEHSLCTGDTLHVQFRR